MYVICNISQAILMIDCKMFVGNVNFSLFGFFLFFCFITFTMRFFLNWWHFNEDWNDLTKQKLILIMESSVLVNLTKRDRWTLAAQQNITTKNHGDALTIRQKKKKNDRNKRRFSHVLHSQKSKLSATYKQLECNLIKSLKLKPTE